MGGNGDGLRRSQLTIERDLGTAAEPIEGAIAGEVFERQDREPLYRAGRWLRFASGQKKKKD